MSRVENLCRQKVTCGCYKVYIYSIFEENVKFFVSRLQHIHSTVAVHIVSAIVTVDKLTLVLFSSASRVAFLARADTVICSTYSQRQCAREKTAT